jgi:hypothetical protein
MAAAAAGVHDCYDVRLGIMAAAVLGVTFSIFFGGRRGGVMCVEKDDCGVFYDG